MPLHEALSVSLWRPKSTFAGTIVRSPAPTFATKWPRFVVPIIVPPKAMIPPMLSRSRTTWLPGGRSPSNPSRKPTTSQPCLSAASTTPRRTAFSPGQSPPLVRTPIRGFMLLTASTRAISWGRQYGRRQPTDRKAASRALLARRLHRSGSCYRAARRSNDAETQ